MVKHINNKNTYLNIIIVLIFIIQSTVSFSQITMSYEAYFTQPEKHYIEIELQCNNLPSQETNFILPVWSPGYYKILDFPKNIVDFKARNSKGESIEWYKTSKNNWIVKNKNNTSILISYRYFANKKSVAESSIDSKKAFLIPNNMFMHVKNNINTPINVQITPYSNWKSINTGLNKINKNTFYANNFDILYDSPIYIGNPLIINFNHEQKTYKLSIEKPEGLKETVFINDLKKIISATTNLMQHVPYKNYSFIMMEAGGGGLEHWNSQAIFTSGSFNFKSNTEYTDFLNFITHEYFHLYNVKAIRPIQLGPFDYSKENYTNMLWVSEGLTVYYEYIIMMRAGLLKKEDTFNYLTRSITQYENIEGKNHMSLAQSSLDIWLNFFNHNENAKETTISYYNKGPVIGLLLDLKIRNATKNKKSLDNVMRLLYNQYYLKENRGFKEEEFWKVCETISGTLVNDIKDYVYTVKEINYQKYLNYAGLKIDLTSIKEATKTNDYLIERSYKITENPNTNQLQSEIRKSIFLLN